MTSRGESLRGLGLLVTRPAHQAQHFIQLLETAGAEAMAFPSIDIQPIEPDSQILARLADYQMLIFISVNAVEYGLRLIRASGHSLTQATIIAIGQRTAQALQRHGVTVSIVPPKGFTSDDLLSMPAMQATELVGKPVLIVRGQGGREYLADSLRARGARPDYLEVYQRLRPRADTRALIDRWTQGRIHAVTVTSNEALKNLYDMLDKTAQDHLLNTVLIVPGQRCAELAEQLGFRSRIVIADSATDEAMLDAIQNWHNEQLHLNKE